MCHSSTTITSCCSMIIHDPMLQGSVHNSWKLKKIPVLAWPAYSPDMSPVEHVWDSLDQRIRQCVPVPANIQQLHTAIEEEWTNSMRRICVTPDTDCFCQIPRYPPPPPGPLQYSKTSHFRVAFNCGQPKAHLCNNHAV